MIRRLNNTARRLWKDESGVVLAFTIIMFLTLFVMALSIFAVGETIRERVEVQNAADAAAYSAAIVQADCNSRIAALNRAMSWCYVQMARMEMDYIVDKWLCQTVEDFDFDDNMMEAINAASECNNGSSYYGTGYGVSDPNPIGQEFVVPTQKGRVRLNRNHMTTRDDIDDAHDEAKAQGKDYESLAGPIDKCRENIDAMNAKEDELIQKLPGRIKKTVEEILKSDIADTWNDGFAGGGGIMYALFQEENPLDKNFRIMELGEEDDFLRHSNYIPDQGSKTKDVLGTGADDWYIAKNETGSPGIQRGYKWNHERLYSEWNYFSSVWVEVDGACVGIVIPSSENHVYGDDPRIRDDRYYVTALAKPKVLTNTFFAAGGSITVGVTRKVNNPFQYMAMEGQLGIIRPFTLDNGNRYMWTATAAIAGYNPKPLEDCKGKYEVTYEDNSGDKLWNLKTSDWDAELIPLHRAGAKGEGHAWVGETAGEILNRVKGGPWIALYGGGGAPGAQGAPKGMNEGAEVNYGGAEGLVVH